jgi:hypothetical protein
MNSHVLCDYICIKCPLWTNPLDREREIRFTETTGRADQGKDSKGMGFSFKVINLSWNWIVVIVVRLSVNTLKTIEIGLYTLAV